MKKKFLSFVLAAFLLIPGVFALTGCNEKHTHAHVNTNEVVIEKGTAYYTTKCSCGDTAKEEIKDAVIVTPTNAQAALDSDINGKTVVFSAGDYGALKVRPTRATLSAIYAYNTSDRLDRATEVEVGALTNTGSYHYVRDLTNVTFAGVDGANFRGLFSIQSKDYIQYNYLDDLETGLSDTILNDFDIIRNIPVANVVPLTSTVGVEDTAYADHINMKNVKFVNMDFAGEYGRILVGSTYTDQVEDITVESCTFITDTPWSFNGGSTGFAGISFRNDGQIDYAADNKKNITINNCVIDGHFQGIICDSANNVTITNNTIKNTIHNAINLQGGQTRGVVLIDGNVIRDVSNRAIRFYILDNATVTISNNTFTNATNGDGQLVKTENNIDAVSSITVSVNTVDNVALADATYTSAVGSAITITK